MATIPELTIVCLWIHKNTDQNKNLQICATSKGPHVKVETGKYIYILQPFTFAEIRKYKKYSLNLINSEQLFRPPYNGKS